MRGRGAGSTVGLAAALGGVLAAGLHVGATVVVPDGTTDFTVTNAVTAIAFGSTGAVVLRARPRHAVGRLLVAIAVGHAVTGLGRELGVVLIDEGRSELGGWALWVGSWTWAVTLWFPLLLLLLPDGDPPTRGGRWLTRAALLVPLPLVVVAALAPGPLLLEPIPQRVVPDNPLGGIDLPPVEALSLLGFVGLAATAVVLLGVRFRQGGVVRQQLAWVLLAGALVVVAVPLGIVVPGLGPVVAPVVIIAFSVAVGFAVVRYRLLDVDVVISRTLTFAALSTVLAAVYVVVVTVVGEVLRGAVGVVPGLFAAAVVAAVAAPLRTSLQLGVDRLFYGQRHDPLAVVRRLGEALEVPAEGGLLHGLGETIATGLRLPSAQVLLEAPDPVPDGHVALPLVHADLRVGTLVLALRAPGEQLTAADERLLTDLARQAAAAAHGVRLTQELQGARVRLVSGREEERRRLRRDLHDGLGPLLAAAAVQLDAVRRISQDPAVDAVLADVRSEISQAVLDVRHLVDDLRPPALDELGLVGAVRAAAERLCTGGPEVVVRGAPDLRVPAAVEVAAFRIACEAVSNAVRHATARRIEVELLTDEAELVVSIADDGSGGAVVRDGGVGLSSMRERAGELGGSTAVREADTGGTVVAARLPLHLAATT